MGSVCYSALFSLLCSLLFFFFFLLSSFAMTSTWTHRVSCPESVFCYLIRVTRAPIELLGLSEVQPEIQVGAQSGFLTALLCLIPWLQQQWTIAFFKLLLQEGESHPCYWFQGESQLWDPSCRTCFGLSGLIGVEHVGISAWIWTRTQEPCSFSPTYYLLFLYCHVYTRDTCGCDMFGGQWFSTCTT